MDPSWPGFAAPLVETARNDIYDTISPSHALAGAAKGLSVLITGAGHGIGAAYPRVFAQAGAAKVVLTGRKQDELESLKAQLETDFEDLEVVAIDADVTKEADVEELFEEAGEVHVLINNAGTASAPASIRDSNPSAWKRTHEVNYFGTYLVTRAYLRQVQQHDLVNKNLKLAILNTSSVSATSTSFGLSDYQTSKNAVCRFTEFCHFETKGDGIRCFAFHPGAIPTDFAKASIPQEYHFILSDTAALAAGFALWLATQPAADFLRGRYVSATWDVDQLVAKKQEIEDKDLLWTRVVGQEQPMPM
ncbi:hypothetical protein Rhopal_005813-T1 [Rhodotorula paludigena]|uniref:NAD(P)-binding protein n=1 Tax=Rhodotorula paludigena TaxID=86838 RepID=A0AAV5GTE9_9BASI|nr:hypothetical protein Rhopal_005813-T1 [Rhodotorula paludigena]